VLYSFGGGTDGESPVGGGLVFDAAGNLYGTTQGGGAHHQGTVFELSPGDGGWTEKILYSFKGLKDGASPNGGVVLDAAGNLYGTTNHGNLLDDGVVFQLSPEPNGKWKENVILRFGHHHDGSSPAAGLVIDGAQNLYGTTPGTVFELSPSNGKWTETVLHRFTGGKNGEYLFSNVILDSGGNLYGTTVNGGKITQTGPCSFGCGVVFMLSPDGKGKWKETVLYRFKGGEDGDGPFAGLVFDAANNLYGTTEQGGGTGCQFQFGCGTAFELTPSAGGEWKETVLRRFKNTKGGQQPMASLILDSAGNLYGTTSGAGAGGAGVGFEIIP
jgi:uncharacterized repeat protein (TIGR03803 family)